MTLSLSDCGFYPMLCVWLRTLQPPFQFVWCMHQARLVAFRPSPLCLWIPQNRIPQNDPSARHRRCPPQRACCDNLIPQNQIPQNARGSLAILCVFVPGLGSPRMIPAPPRLPPLRACCDNLIPQNQIPQNALHRAAPNPQVSDPPEL